MEGFVVPLGRRNIEQEIHEFFMREFGENCYPPHNIWTEKRVSDLGKIVTKVPVSLSTPNSSDERREFLRLNTEKMGECIEAWIPVISVYGEALLVLKNSD